MCGILCVPFFGPVCRVEIRGSQLAQVCGTRPGFASRLQISLHRGVLLANVSERPAIRIKVRAPNQREKVSILWCSVFPCNNHQYAKPGKNRTGSAVWKISSASQDSYARNKGFQSVCCACVCVCARAQAGDIVGVDHRRPLSVEALGKSTGASEPTIGRRQDELPNAGNWFLHLADIEGRYPL